MWHRKKAGGVRSRYVVRQYRTEWSEDAFCGVGGAIRLLLAVASLMRWMVMPGDFSTAFMHTPLLDSDEYWIEPPREVVPDKRYVWKLKKALNGLVAASKRFQQYLFRLLRDLAFESCPLLPTLLRNPITGTIMVVHVDNPMASGPPGGGGEALRGAGNAHCPRGRGSRCTVRRRRSTWARDSGAPNPGSWRCRRKATSRASGPLRNRRGGNMSRGGRGAATPGIMDKPKTKDDEEYIGRELHSIYRQIVGKVQYITPRRPDVMFALKEAARHLQEPRWFDWYRLGRLVRYLCDTGSYAMHLQHSGNTERNSSPTVTRTGQDAQKH